MITRRCSVVCLVAVGCALLAGCGAAGGGGIHGTVTLDGEPLSDVVVWFIPDKESNTPGNGGVGRTDTDGIYTLKTPQGGSDIVPGAYRVVLSRLLTPDGKPLPANSETDPISSNAQESLPPRYSSEERTELTATVTDDGKPLDFNFTSKASPE